MILIAVDAVFYKAFIGKGSLGCFKTLLIYSAVRAKAFGCIINGLGTFNAQGRDDFFKFLFTVTANIAVIDGFIINIAYEAGVFFRI